MHIVVNRTSRENVLYDSDGLSMATGRLFRIHVPVATANVLSPNEVDVRGTPSGVVVDDLV